MINIAETVQVLGKIGDKHETPTVYKNASMLLLNFHLTENLREYLKHICLYRGASVSFTAEHMGVSIHQASIALKKLHDLRYLERRQETQESGGIEYCYSLIEYEIDIAKDVSVI